MPGEGNSPQPSGREIIAIEETFGLDGLKLLSTLADTEPSQIKGYTKVKAIFAMAWISMTRGGEVLSLDDVLNDYAIDEFEMVEESEESKKEPASSEAELAAE